jgi:hypothetical protein
VSKEAVSKLAFPKIVKPADLECGSLLPPSKTAHLLRAQDFTKKAQTRLVRKLCLRALQRLRPPNPKFNNIRQVHTF